MFDLSRRPRILLIPVDQHSAGGERVGGRREGGREGVYKPKITTLFFASPWKQDRWSKIAHKKRHQQKHHGKI